VKTITSLDQAIKKALDHKSHGESSADFKIEVDGELWSCYTAAIVHRDILLYCNEGTATFLVDSYGEKNVVELFDWEKDVSQ